MCTARQNFISMLKRSGIYHRLRASSVWGLYIILKNRKVFEDRERQDAFYRNITPGFRPGDLVFDIGANIGDKTDTFLRIGARVIAVDPDPRNQAILRQKFLRYRLTPRPVTVVGKAIGATVGVETLLTCAPGSAFNTLSKKGGRHPE